MILSSSCPPWQPDQTGQKPAGERTHCRSYNTPWGTIFLKISNTGHKQIDRCSHGGEISYHRPSVTVCEKQNQQYLKRHSGSGVVVGSGSFLQACWATENRAPTPGRASSLTCCGSEYLCFSGRGSVLETVDDGQRPSCRRWSSPAISCRNRLSAPAVARIIIHRSQVRSDARCWAPIIALSSANAFSKRAICCTSLAWLRLKHPE